MEMYLLMGDVNNFFPASSVPRFLIQSSRPISGCICRQVTSVLPPSAICHAPVITNITAMPLKKEYLIILRKKKAKSTATVPSEIKITPSIFFMLMSASKVVSNGLILQQ